MSSPAKQPQRGNHDEKLGDVLQASTTVAGLVMAFVILLPSISQLVILRIGATDIPLIRPVLLLCGLFSLMASIWTIDSMRRETNVPLSFLFIPRSHLGFLFLALCLFLFVYLGVVISI